MRACIIAQRLAKQVTGAIYPRTSPRRIRGLHEVIRMEVCIHSTFSRIFTMKARWLGANSRTALMILDDPVCGLERLRHAKRGN
jgi:hypothetical protein